MEIGEIRKRIDLLDDGAILRLFERVVDESRRLERIKSQGEGPEKC